MELGGGGGIGSTVQGDSGIKGKGRSEKREKRGEGEERRYSRVEMYSTAGRGSRG